MFIKITPPNLGQNRLCIQILNRQRVVIFGALLAFVSIINCVNGRPFWDHQYDTIHIRYRLTIINNTLDTLRITQSASIDIESPTTKVDYDSTSIIPPNQIMDDSVYCEYVNLIDEENNRPVYFYSSAQIQDEYIEGSISFNDTNCFFKYSLIDTNELEKSKRNGYWIVYCDEHLLNYDTLIIH
jgi:hypothetical protein